MIKLEADGGIGAQVLTRTQIHGQEIALLGEAQALLCVLCQTFEREAILGLSADQMLDAIVRGARRAMAETQTERLADGPGLASVRVPREEEQIQ